MKYFLLFILFNSLLYGQFLAPPYELELEQSVTAVFVSDIQRKDGTVFFLNAFNMSDGQPEAFRISDSTLSLVKIYNYHYEKIIKSTIKVIDINDDNEDEIIFLSQFEDRIEIRILFPFTGYEKILFSYNTYKKNYSAETFVAVTDNETGAFFVSLAESYPDENTLRGIFSFNISYLSLNWFLPLGEYINSLVYSDIDKKLYYTTVSYNNKFSFNAETKKFNAKGVDTKSIESFLSDKFLAPLFSSSDTVSYFRSLSLAGNLIKSTQLGEKYCSSSLQKKDNYFFGISFFYGIEESNKQMIFHYDIENDLFRVLHKFKYSSLVVTRLFYYKNYFHFVDNNIVKYISDEGTIFSRFEISDRIKISLIDYFICDETFIYAGKGNDIFIFNDAGEIIAETPKVKLIFYIPKLNRLVTLNDGITQVFTLKERTFFERITPDTYYYSSIIFGLLIIFILFFWLLTMNISKKKIEKQKMEIEKSHKELSETTLKLVETEKLAVLGTIASSIAHEINSPLGAILNSAERINNLDYKDDTLIQNSRLIQKAALRSKTIIEKFLLASRPHSVDEITNINTVLNDWKELFEKQFTLNGITIRYDVDETISVKVPYEELTQVFINLLFNAKDAVTSSKKEEKLITVIVKRAADKAVIEILDTGDGFKKEVLDKVFTAFVTTKSPGKGTGLGLWICKRIITDANGSISVSNTETGAKVEIIMEIYEG